jgi:hypothetical protein
MAGTATATGTYTLSDLVRVQFMSELDIIRRSTVNAFGQENFYKLLAAELAAYNKQVQEQLDFLVTYTTDRYRAYGGKSSGRLQKLDGFGKPVTQKRQVAKGTVGFPLYKYGDAIGWTEDAFDAMTVLETSQNVMNMTIENNRAIAFEIKTALYKPTNTTVIDELVDGTSLPVKALVNADGDPIPSTPNGNTFDGTTHTHYVAPVGGVLTNAEANTALNNLIEHEQTGEPMIIINAADELTWRAFADFHALIDARIVQPAITQDVYVGRLNMLNPYSRHIGYFGAAAVWVKPWAVANYTIYLATGGDKALAMRQRDQPNLQGLRLVAQNRAFPLLADTYVSEFGIGVSNRIAAVVQKNNATTYSAPTITE